ncbi:hypothetical protein ACJX0J_024987 [Zea mays]
MPPLDANGYGLSLARIVHNWNLRAHDNVFLVLDTQELIELPIMLVMNCKEPNMNLSLGCMLQDRELKLVMEFYKLFLKHSGYGLPLRLTIERDLIISNEKFLMHRIILGPHDTSVTTHNKLDISNEKII